MYEHLNYNEIPRGREYKPELTIHSLNSKGQSARISGIKSYRQHDLLSRNEQNYFFIAEFSDSVIDIREQFPLNIDKTLLIAQQLGLKHPIDNKTNEPIIMTSDFCITLNSGSNKKDIIRTIKPSAELTNPRTLQKFEIERVYWEHEKLNWGIVTDREINKTMAKNISSIRVAYDLTPIPELHDIDERILNDYKRELARRLVSIEEPTRMVIHNFAKDYHLPVGACITLFRHLLATKVLNLNLRKELDLNQVNLISFNHAKMDELLCAQ